MPAKVGVLTVISMVSILRKVLFGKIQRFEVFLGATEDADVYQIVDGHGRFVAGAVGFAFLRAHGERDFVFAVRGGRVGGFKRPYRRTARCFRTCP